MISAAGNKTQAQGFTLVEVLVVMVILALTSAVVLTALPRSRSEAEQAARQFALGAEQLADAALMDGRPRGLSVTEAGVEAFVFVDGNWQRQPSTGGDLASDVQYTLTPADGFGLEPDSDQGELVFRDRRGVTERDDDAPAFPDLVFNPTGEVTAYTLEVAGRREAYSVTGTADGRVEVRDAAAP